MSKTWKDNKYQDLGNKRDRDLRKAMKKAKKDQRKAERQQEAETFNVLDTVDPSWGEF